MKNKGWLVFNLTIVILLTFSVAIFAQDYPSGNVDLICPYGAGGGTDAITRALAKGLEEELGQPFVVTNRTGAGGAIAFNEVVTSNPDGYTLALAAQPITTLSVFQGIAVSHQTVKPIAQVNYDPAAVLVNTDSDWDSIEELVSYAKDNPGELKIGVTSPGAAWWIGAQVFLDRTNVEMNQIVYPAGAAPILKALASNELDVGVTSAAEGLSMVESGRIKYLGIMSEDRLSIFSETPTIKEQGYDVVHGTWRGLIGPPAMSDEKVEIIEQATKKVVESEDFIEFMTNNKFGIQYRNAENFGEYMEAEYVRFQELKESLEN